MWIRDLQEENGCIWDWIYEHEKQLDVAHARIMMTNSRIQSLERDLLNLTVQSLGIQRDFEHFIEDHWHPLQGLIWDSTHHLPKHCFHCIADGNPYFGPLTWGFNYQGSILASSLVHAGSPLSSSSCPSLIPGSSISNEPFAITSPFSSFSESKYFSAQEEAWISVRERGEEEEALPALHFWI